MAKGFDLPNHWLACHARAGCKVPKLGQNARRAMHRHMCVLMSTYSLTQDEMKAVMDFAFLHNPFGDSTFKAYGLVTAKFGPLVTAFRRWRRSAAKTIDEEAGGNLRYAVYLTAPEQDTISDRLLADVASALVKKGAKGVEGALDAHLEAALG